MKALIDDGRDRRAGLRADQCLRVVRPGIGPSEGLVSQRDLAGGGPMFDFGCHRLEVLTQRVRPGRRVSGMVANVHFSRDVEDTAVAVLEFESGGCAVVSVTHAAQEARDTIEIFGSRGSLFIAHLNKGDLRVRQSGAERIESHPPARTFTCR